MNKFNIGDQVKILGHIKQTGIIGIIESIDVESNVAPMYSIKDNNGYCIKNISENILEKVEMNIFEKVMFEQEQSNSEAFFEMSGRLPRDPSGRCKLVIAVGGREKNIAHFHVFRSEEDKEAWKNGACFFFTENRYYDHRDNAETLTEDELEELVELLKKPYKRNNSITNWQQLVYLWNDNNDRYEIPDDTPMPNYDYKTIERYKE